MGVGTLLRRRLLTHPVALVAVATSVLMSMVVVATLQLLSSSIADASVRTTLDVPGDRRSVALTAGVRPGELADVDRRVRAALAPGGPDAVVTRTSTVTSRGIEGRADTDRASLADVSDLPARARLTAGAWPTGAGRRRRPGRRPARGGAARGRCRCARCHRGLAPGAHRPRRRRRGAAQRARHWHLRADRASTTACGSTTHWASRESTGRTSRPTARSWPLRGRSTAPSPGRRPRRGAGSPAGTTSPPTTCLRSGPGSTRSSMPSGTPPASGPTAPPTRTLRSQASRCATPGSARGCRPCSMRRPWSASACVCRSSRPPCCSSCWARHPSSWPPRCWRRCATARPG